MRPAGTTHVDGQSNSDERVPERPHPCAALRPRVRVGRRQGLALAAVLLVPRVSLERGDVEDDRDEPTPRPAGRPSAGPSCDRGDGVMTTAVMPRRIRRHGRHEGLPERRRTIAVHGGEELHDLEVLAAAAVGCSWASR